MAVADTQLESLPRRIVRKVGGPAVPALGRYLARCTGGIVSALIERRLAAQPELVPWYESMSDERARVHFGDEEIVEQEHLRRGMRLFHAWRVVMVRERLGNRLGEACFLDVGDTDGLMLKDLGKTGIGFNFSPAAVRNIESNGTEAVLGDGHSMPFEDHSFDCILCFETLEHVENPHQLLGELARLCSPDGRVFISIPWVPDTQIQPRDPGIARGYGHAFEFDREDFLALVSHSAVEVCFDTSCDILGKPGGPVQALFLLATRNRHLVGGGFRRFQFFELAPRR